MLTQHEMRIIKKSLQNMNTMGYMPPHASGSGPHEMYISREAVIELLEEFCGEERTSVTTQNFSTLFREALSDHNDDMRKKSSP